MKTLGTKSLSAVLSGIIQVVWWVELVAVVGITAAIITTPFFKEQVSFNTPVTFSNVSVKNVEAAVPNLPAGELIATDGNFSFLVQTNLVNTLIMAAVFMAAFTFLILVTYQLKLIFSSFKKNEPFMAVNINRIKKIGFIVIVYAIAKLLYSIALNQYLLSHFKWEGSIKLTYSVNLIALFAGATLIILAEIFKLGAFLDEEQKLTI